MPVEIRNEGYAQRVNSYMDLPERKGKNPKRLKVFHGLGKKKQNLRAEAKQLAKWEWNSLS